MRKGSNLLVILIVVMTSCAGLDATPTAVWLCTGQRIARIRRKRVIVYMRGTDAEIDEQLQFCYDLCAGRGWDPVGAVRERPGETAGWWDAQRMLYRGEVDLVVVASGDVVPEVIASATGTFPGPRAGRHVRRAAGHRRTRPTRRGDAGA
jgi:hypothetical protein